MDDRTLANDPFLRLHAYRMIGRDFTNSLAGLLTLLLKRKPKK